MSVVIGKLFAREHWPGLPHPAPAVEALCADTGEARIRLNKPKRASLDQVRITRYSDGKAAIIEHADEQLAGPI